MKTELEKLLDLDIKQWWGMYEKLRKECIETPCTDEQKAVLYEYMTGVLKALKGLETP